MNFKHIEKDFGDGDPHSIYRIYFPDRRTPALEYDDMAYFNLITIEWE
jgi:hypothetical protein